MKALVYHGPGKISWEEKQKPALREGTDAIVQISKTTICGTDLHILKGDVPSVTAGRILGHEGIGVVYAVGDGVVNFRVGDKVLIGCITTDGKCPYCRIGMYSHCEHGGWILGNTIDGTQAQFVRIPYADTSLHLMPKGVVEEAVVMLSDILPTGFECGVCKSRVKPGDVMGIVGAGPVGLSALLTAQLFSPLEIVVIDVNEHRLEMARKFGATKTINAARGKTVARVMELTSNRGVDVAVEAVGNPAAFDVCQDIVAPGGHIANIGVHGKSVSLHLEKLWSHNITLTTRLVDTVSIPLLMKIIASGRIHPEELISHHFNLTEIVKAYDIFENAEKEKTMKVILSNE